MIGAPAIAPRWPSIRARFLFNEVNERGYDLPLASVTRYGGVEFRADLDTSVWNPGDDVSSYKRVRPGDFVIGLRSFQSGLGFSPLEGLVSPAYSVLRPRRRDMDAGYFRYLLKSDILVSLLDNISQGIRQGRTIAVEDFSELRLPLPPLAAQRAVADYLDGETARIDALVVAKRRLVELADERLAAVVSAATHARSAMSSGPPVPERWTLMPLKRSLSSTDYGIGEATQPDGDYAVLGMTNINSGAIVGTPGGFVSEVEHTLLLRPGDLLFNRTNSRELVGKVALVKTLDGPTTFASYLVRLRTNKLADPDYLNFLLNTREILGLARSMALPSIGQANLNPSRYASIAVPIPPLDDQHRIVGELDAVTSQVRSVVEALEKQLHLLQEHRSVLITAAVTGSIDISSPA
jgi:type I restriction enzyme, S subunit